MKRKFLQYTLTCLAYIFLAYGLSFAVSGKNYAEFNVALFIGLLNFTVIRHFVKDKHVLYMIFNVFISIIVAVILTGILWFFDHKFIVYTSTALLAVIFIFTVVVFFFYAYRYYISRNVKWYFIISSALFILCIVIFHVLYTGNYAHVLLHLSAGFVFLTIAILLFEHRGTIIKDLDETNGEEDGGNEEENEGDEQEEKEKPNEDGEKNELDDEERTYEEYNDDEYRYED